MFLPVLKRLITIEKINYLLIVTQKDVINTKTICQNLNFIRIRIVYATSVTDRKEKPLGKRLREDVVLLTTVTLSTQTVPVTQFK